jgi:hypothetical protein
MPCILTVRTAMRRRPTRAAICAPAAAQRTSRRPRWAISFDSINRVIATAHPLVLSPPRDPTSSLTQQNGSPSDSSPDSDEEEEEDVRDGGELSK